VRATDAYNLDLSQRRVNSVMRYMVEQGVAAERLQATGYGHTRTLVDDSACDRPDEELDPKCVELTSLNRRVEFHIVRWDR
jgi:OOP family OmpA-OmpF porin